MGIKQSLRAIFPARLYERMSEWKYAFFTLVSPKWNSRARWRQVFGRPLPLEHPVEFNEKLMWLKLFCYNKSPFVRRLADKYQVMAYVAENGLAHQLKTCYGVWDRPEEIDFDALPDRFVLKTTLGCGHHVFCYDKAAFDRDAAVRALRGTQRSREYLLYAEMQYRPTGETPNRILCERLLDADGGRLPNDYKLYCYFGEPRFVLTCFDRRAEGASYLFTDAEWNRLDYHPSTPTDGPVPRPGCLDEMLDGARRLSAPFPFVRVDYYEENGRAIFGEMTFTPAGCLDRMYTETGRVEMAKPLDLSRFDPAALIRRKK